MKLENTYAEIIEKYPEYINQKQMSEICGFTPKTARKYEKMGRIKSTTLYNPNNPLIHQHKILLMDVLAFLYRRECREELDSDFIIGMYGFYAEKYKKYSDLLTVKHIMEMTGFSSSAIINWISRKELFAFKRGKVFLIPKSSFLEFVTSPYYRRIKNKTKIQKTFILEYENSFEEVRYEK